MVAGDVGNAGDTPTRWRAAMSHLTLAASTQSEHRPAISAHKQIKQRRRHINEMESGDLLSDARGINTVNTDQRRQHMNRSSNAVESHRRSSIRPFGKQWVAGLEDSTRRWKAL
jgi:hypothetical protein